MATSRSNVIVLIVALSLACVRAGAPDTVPAAQTVTVSRKHIEHVVPRRDFVGPTPTRFEWTAVDGVESYSVSIETEIEIPIFEQDGIKDTAIALPKDTKLDPGTYFWRVVGMNGDRNVADSGRAAFVVLEP
jgi:hypothetical protein